MQENEFEKQIQQKMEELKLNPSDAVWQKIEPQIKKEKPKKRMLILWPILLIAFLYGGYVYINSNDTTVVPVEQLTTNSIEKNNSHQQKTNVLDSIKYDEPISEQQINTPTTTTQNRKQQKRKLPSNINGSSNKTIAEILNVSPKTVDKSSNDKVKNSVDTEPNQLPEEKAITTVIAPVTNIPEHNGGIQKQKDTVNTIEENNKVAINDIQQVPKETKKAVKNQSSWNYGFAFSVGSSAMATSLLGSLVGNGQKSAGPQNLPPGNTNTAGSAPTPSIIKPGLGFIACISTEKNITGKIKFSSGVNYKSFSTTNTTGADSGAYYRAYMDMNIFRNRYHYIELPVSLKFDIVDLKKAKLQWSAGVSISRLIKAKALQYDGSRGYYYHDNSLFNKTQIGFHTGIDIEILLKQKRSLAIGPHYYYGISKVAPTGYNKHHFAFVGLKAQYFFRKK